MARFVARSPMPVDADTLFAWHARKGALERLLPPWAPMRLEKPGRVADGAEVVLRMGRRPVQLRWEARLRDVEPGRGFADEQVRGPFARWLHRHRFLPAEGRDGRDGGSLLEDDIEWALPGGALGHAVGGAAVRSNLERTFAFRHVRTRDDLARQAEFADRPRLCVAITGATGLVGQALEAFLSTAGHRVLRVTRSPRPGSDDVGWDPARARLDVAALRGADAVVHLAGESVFGLRWSEAKKRAIRESRVRGTDLLARGLTELERPPRTLVSASALGWYGDRGDERLSETSAPGAGFLAEVCRDWEAATAPLEKAGVRVVHLRTGVVLSAAGGALATMLPVFRAGLGGRIGSGRQGTSWISLDDVVGAIHFLLHRPEVSGPVNATAPMPVSNAEFTRLLGRVLRRPTLVPAPEVALRAALGQLADEVLLAGAFVHPDALERAGFRFLHPDLEGALRLELGRLQSRLHVEHG
jgi:uncharacterized protein (TIGR01777 family)